MEHRFKTALELYNEELAAKNIKTQIQEEDVGHTCQYWRCHSVKSTHTCLTCQKKLCSAHATPTCTRCRVLSAGRDLEALERRAQRRWEAFYEGL